MLPSDAADTGAGTFSDENSPAITVSDEAPSDAESGISVSRLPLEEKLFFVVHDTSRKFRVVRYRNANVQRWHLLPRERLAIFQGMELKVGDLIVCQVLTDPMAVAEIVEIRAVEDGRRLLRIIWFVRRLSALKELGAERESDIIPSSYRFVKSAHTQVIVWDTVKRVMDVEQRRKCMTDQVLCYLGRGRARLCPADSGLAKWTVVREG